MTDNESGKDIIVPTTQDESELQKAINHYEYRVNKRQEDIDFYRNSHNQELILAADTLKRALVRDKIILTALQQMQKPADAEVQDLIKFYQSDLDGVPRYIEEIKKWHDSNRQKEFQIKYQNERMKDDKIILAALQQHRTEPSWRVCSRCGFEAVYCPHCGNQQDGGEAK